MFEKKIFSYNSRKIILTHLEVSFFPLILLTPLNSPRTVQKKKKKTPTNHSKHHTKGDKKGLV